MIRQTFAMPSIIISILCSSFPSQSGRDPFDHPDWIFELNTMDLGRYYLSRMVDVNSSSGTARTSLHSRFWLPLSLPPLRTLVPSSMAKSSASIRTVDRSSTTCSFILSSGGAREQEARPVHPSRLGFMFASLRRQVRSLQTAVQRHVSAHGACGIVPRYPAQFLPIFSRAATASEEARRRRAA
jgi:hypothetical protein